MADLAFYRVAYFSGLTPTNLQLLVDEETDTKVEEPLAVWPTADLEDGLYTLLLTAVRQDGSFEELSLQLTVDAITPTVRLTSPAAGQQIPASQERLILSAEATDNVAIAQVAFFMDGEADPIAIRAAEPFVSSWALPAAGCYELTAVATDTAGNQTSSPPTPFCITEP